MKRFLFVASAIAVGAANAAHAADLPMKAPIAPPLWAGGYGGVAGGYGWGNSGQTDPGIPVIPPLVIEGDQDGYHPVRGGLLGVTLGRNWQGGRWVLGVEGDFSWADIGGSSSVCGPNTAAPHPCGARIDALGTFRGRAGLVAGADGNWLLYATGGLAVGHLHGWDVLTPSSGSVWRAGWTAGAGVETAFAPNWTAKLEYLYADLGHAQIFNVFPGVPESVSFTANIVRAGINYRFGDPVAAPYAKVPYAKAPVLAPVNMWGGWYAGLNAGYLDGDRQVNTDAVVIANSTTARTAPAMASGATSQLATGQGGYLGGAQFGYNLMLSPMLLAGFEADIQGSSLRGNAGTTTAVLTDTVFGANTGTWQTSIAVSRGLDYIGTVRGRLGATVAPNLLLYVTGGLAYGGVKSSTVIDQTTAILGVPANRAARSFSDNRAGYTVGGGGEWMLMSKWSVKVEYLYYDLGSANYGTGNLLVDEGPTQLPGFGTAAIGTSTRVRFNGNIVRVGLNYHLN
jgi:outer membrane immunogenic protein